VQDFFLTFEHVVPRCWDMDTRFHCSGSHHVHPPLHAWKPASPARVCPACHSVHRRSSFLRVCATVLPSTGWRLATRAGLWALGALTRAHSMATTHVVPNLSTRIPRPPRAARPRHAPSHGLQQLCFHASSARACTPLTPTTGHARHEPLPSCDTALLLLPPHPTHSHHNPHRIRPSAHQPTNPRSRARVHNIANTQGLGPSREQGHETAVPSHGRASVNAVWCVDPPPPPPPHTHTPHTHSRAQLRAASHTPGSCTARVSLEWLISARTTLV
jgi:hypothetical protein